MARKKNEAVEPTIEAPAEAFETATAEESADTLPAETPAQTLDVITPHELADRLHTTGTGATKLAIVRESADVNAAIAALEKAGHKVTADKARAIIAGE